MNKRDENFLAHNEFFPYRMKETSRYILQTLTLVNKNESTEAINFSMYQTSEEEQKKILAH